MHTAKNGAYAIFMVVEGYVYSPWNEGTTKTEQQNHCMGTIRVVCVCVGGGGGWNPGPTLIGVLRNTGGDPWKIAKPPSHPPTSKTPYKWHFAGRSMMAPIYPSHQPSVK